MTPINGTWVCMKGVEGRGVVEAQRHGEKGAELRVLWLKDQRRAWVRAGALRCGFPLQIEVQDVPRSRIRKSLGEGVVVETREIGGTDQVLVEFPQTGRLVWLPYENLRHIKGVRQRFELGQTGEEGSAERFRLRSLAYALEMWNENTGSLSRLDIDPLPHQIHLVHHILKSGNLNWLIADDVGLGKTIEVGMLLSALKQRGKFRRILLITPAGLIRQWQDEMRHKFALDDFLIYGVDFQINEPSHWKLYDHVIGSMDLFKGEAHIEKLLQAEPWDLIVFDEGHRLSRTQWGMKFDASERYRLAAKLREHTDALILLSGTPHQGKQDKFQALLELIRPEWRDQIESLELNPQILSQMVIRNSKADVTDSEGNFIFKGKITRAIQVPLGAEERQFEDALKRYLTQGYAAGRRLGALGRAIGFVMTIYRKLAASSIAAIEAALLRRAARLHDEHRVHSDPNIDEDQAFDERFAGEWEETFSGSEKEFFEGEMRLLEELIGKAHALLKVDRKIRTFVDELVGKVLELNPQEKVLIFTEYRNTQEYIAEALRDRMGPEAVDLIHGSMDYKERAAAIAHFEDHGQFLISTEAGGEGINLQRRCHIMVNFDLPWNPMRLVQRLGRLYRYGQTQKVVVFNVHAPQTLDAQIMGLMYQRIDQVVHDMATLGGEYRAGLEDEILGQLADVLEVEDILEEANQAGEKPTQQRIEEALKRAREAVEKQRELFSYATGFDPAETRGELAIARQHAMAFLAGMLPVLGIELVEEQFKGAVLDLRIPDEMREALGWNRQRVRVTFDRNLAANRQDIEVLDFSSVLFNHLITEATRYEFGGLCAGVRKISGRAILTSMLRWQNDQGMRMRQEYAALAVAPDGTVRLNPEEFSQWLLKPATDVQANPNRDEGRALITFAQDALDHRLGELANDDLHPENRQLVSAAWIAGN